MGEKNDNNLQNKMGRKEYGHLFPSETNTGLTGDYWNSTLSNKRPIKPPKYDVFSSQNETPVKRISLLTNAPLRPPKKQSSLRNLSEREDLKARRNLKGLQIIIKDCNESSINGTKNNDPEKSPNNGMTEDQAKRWADKVIADSRKEIDRLSKLYKEKESEEGMGLKTCLINVMLEHSNLKWNNIGGQNEMAGLIPETNMGCQLSYVRIKGLHPFSLPKREKVSYAYTVLSGDVTVSKMMTDGSKQKFRAGTKDSFYMADSTWFQISACNGEAELVQFILGTPTKTPENQSNKNLQVYQPTTCHCELCDRHNSNFNK